MTRKTLYQLILSLTLSLPLISGDLPIPPLLEGPDVHLKVQKGSLTLPFGESDTLGYNGDYLGPTLRFRRGQQVNIQVENTLREDTTVHWHGLHVPAEFDGGPHQVIPRRSNWNPRFEIKQAAATLWYHPHLMGRTGEQVYRGLAGLFIIDDKISDSLDIPRDYGENDIPLILQDRRIDRSGTFRYRPSGPDIMHGYLGNVVLTNGAFQPQLVRPAGTYRFRILNGSNSTLIRISFKDGRDFTVIAGDGGFLPETVETDLLILSPGERNEILVDFNPSEEAELITELYGGETQSSLTIKTTARQGSFFTHPSALPSPVIDDPGYRTPDRIFRMETRGMGRFTINGRTMDMNRVDFTLPGEAREVWMLENRGMGMMQIPHSFHLHDTQFRVLEVNGEAPPPLLRGPKDTVLLMPGERMLIAVAFGEYQGLYMYHCHMLEHEDQGMMGQFLLGE